MSNPSLHCMVTQAFAEDWMRTHKDDSPLRTELNRLLARLRHVSRQSTLPRGDDFAAFFIRQANDLPPLPKWEPYFGPVGFGDRTWFETALTIRMVEAAGALPADFEPEVYGGVLLDAFKALKDNDYRTALFSTALAIEAVAGTVLDEEHQRLLRATPLPPHIRVLEAQDDGAGEREDPIFKYLRKNGRFENLLHEIPFYVLGKSLKVDDPEAFKLAKKLYQTRNSLAHRGEPSKDRDLIPLTLEGTVDALKCATQIFTWFGVPGKWPIPFEEAVDSWRRKQTDAEK